MTPAATTVAARTASASGAALDRGRNRITSKALNRVVAAVTAEALGVKASRVAVDLADEKGLLLLTVTTPI
ncbi:MAG: hypothetical protein Q7T71_05665, partial [Herbiconiux sp.]|nr:hypothetical protein [Herbiconiux sp.]